MITHARRLTQHVTNYMSILLTYIRGVSLGMLAFFDVMGKQRYTRGKHGRSDRRQAGWRQDRQMVAGQRTEDSYVPRGAAGVPERSQYDQTPRNPPKTPVKSLENHTQL